MSSDVRQQIATVLLDSIDGLTADTVAVFPYSAVEHPLDERYCSRLGHVLVELLAFAVRDARVDPRGEFVADLHRIALERSLSAERVFTCAYLVERAALDELALNETLGATSEPWPLVAHPDDPGRRQRVPMFPLEGKPLDVGGWNLRPRARLRARVLTVPGAAGWTATLSPEAVEVEQDGGVTTIVEMAGPANTTGALVAAGALVAVGCMLVVFLARRGASHPSGR